MHQFLLPVPACLIYSLASRTGAPCGTTTNNTRLSHPVPLMAFGVGVGVGVPSLQEEAEKALAEFSKKRAAGYKGVFL